MAQWVKCSPQKHVDLRLIPSTHVKARMEANCNLSDAEAEMGGSLELAGQSA